MCGNEPSEFVYLGGVMSADNKYITLCNNCWELNDDIKWGKDWVGITPWGQHEGQPETIPKISNLTKKKIEKYKKNSV